VLRASEKAKHRGIMICDPRILLGAIGSSAKAKS